MPKPTYQAAGVDLLQYREAMGRLPRLMQRTFSPRVIRQDGGFAGLFALDFADPLFSRNYREPVLVACTDGVGTKLKIAQRLGRHDTIGVDLVAMCVNDALCCGAEPLFFLDYIALAEDDPERLEQIVAGVSAGCLEADCALIGGETAIMPSVYAAGEYDLAGFAVGVAERKRLIDGRSIAPGDVAIGVAASGFHANGFSLIRHVLDQTGAALDGDFEGTGQSVGETLLRPTRIYANCVRQILRHYRVKNVVHGIAHITGGGLLENTERILPAGVRLELDAAAWEVPPEFRWLQSLGGIDEAEMWRVFNMGIGLVLVVSPYYGNSIGQVLGDAGFPHWVIGEVRENAGAVGSVAWRDAPT